MNTLTYASFPVSETTQTEVVAENIELPTYGRSQPIWGILSCVFAVVIILMLSSMPGSSWLLPWLLSPLVIIFGAIGFNKKLKGLAISGFVLSLISLVVLILYILILFLSAASLGAAFGG